MSDNSNNGTANVMGILFAIAALLLVWKSYQAVRSHPEPSISTPYEQNAIPMAWTDDCGEESVCVWYWLYDEGTIDPETKLPEMPGWQLHYGPDFPSGSRPVVSLPVLAVQP